MPSHLTRNVFRRLLAHDGFRFRCPYSSGLAIRRRYDSTAVWRSPGRRTLFGFAAKPPRQAKETDLDPGLSPMLDLMMMKKLGARPPQAVNLVKAFNTFFAYKTRVKEPVNRIQAEHALRTFRHLRDTNTDHEGFGLTLTDLKVARDAMIMMPLDKTDLHNIFAREMYEEIRSRKLEGNSHTNSVMADLVQFVTVLTQTGDSVEARRLAEEFSRTITQGADGIEDKSRRKAAYKLWNLVLKGFALEMNEVELLKTARIAQQYEVPYTATFHRTMTTFFARKNDFQGARTWFEKEIFRNRAPSSHTVSEVLQFCLRNDQLEWCNSVFKQLLETNPDKQTWDVIFQWAAGALGKGVEDVEHMMEVMVRHNKKDSQKKPDIETINGLVSVAMARKDPYLAERYLGLGFKSGIHPNARTYILQMDYRIDAGDLRGAQAAYELLQTEEISDGEDLPVINRYIRALCASPTSQYDRITSIVLDLEERKVRLDADTVSALSVMYLKRDELQDVLDILNTHTFHYNLEERTRIRDALLEFCLDPDTNTTRVWEAYTIIRQIFDETSTAIRTRLMSEFFNRNRCDMACHVFGHMRQHIDPKKRPTRDNYIQCFEGIAKCKDAEHLDMIHNMMKMDSSIEVSTKLYNALMLAYTACDQPYRALDFWTDITNSREGPTYSSLQIVFRACEIRPFGDKPAKEIWNKMRKLEIEVTPEVFSAYVGALAGQNLVEEVKELIAGMQSDLGFGLDMTTYVLLKSVTET